ncbi:RNA polymerase sigma factor SigJ [Humibacter ginsenosidimutans]|uniref:Sigma-70 family RNA polymerase sigma factor n=1 Tax=Humibacter ginsenosidimutans TaxID=2599293 RepID=A0A5B8MAE1_9MICO|nr:RNA polymerase sigma factor SigJ [Humibacter ginsenosidimutans]QDZ16500.1 sigma-70 family RNA polymerase sigma factor [Humibacter ginsenosidimutans]
MTEHPQAGSVPGPHHHDRDERDERGDHDARRDADADERVAAERPALLGLAYRLLGSLADAEDVVQEAFGRWYAMTPEQRGEIRSPGAWLSTVASRICLDLLGSARRRRERYVGEWIPEPVPDAVGWATSTAGAAASTPSDPAERVTLDESITMAFLVVLEAMSPAERVSFVLHDVFGYSFAEIAEIVGRTPAACRQLAYSARRRLSAPREQHGSDSRAQDEVVADLRRAWERKDIGALIGILDPSVVLVADGGGRVNAALHPMVGAEEVARYFVAIAQLAPDLTIEERTVNGRPGLLALQNGEVAAVAALEIVHGRVTNVWAMRNPDKLRAWTGM